MNALLVILKEIQIADLRIIRRLMLKCIHHKQPLDAPFIINFRNRVVLYHARNPQYPDLPMKYAQLLVSRKELTTEEYNILNNPSTRLHFNDMFR